jgi:hypothetical protein
MMASKDTKMSKQGTAGKRIQQLLRNLKKLGRLGSARSQREVTALYNTVSSTIYIRMIWRSGRTNDHLWPHVKV